ncbi:unnamed protein product [Laminaria digitata]
MYDDVVLFEDFIHDHGVVRMSVKTRTMPRCWYVLLRYWLRVDGVVMKVIDTRYFHKFGERSVYRERTQHCATFASLQERGLSTDPSVYSDADAALPVLELSSGKPIPSVTMHGTNSTCTCTHVLGYLIGIRIMPIYARGGQSTPIPLRSKSRLESCSVCTPPLQLVRQRRVYARVALS